MKCIQCGTELTNEDMQSTSCTCNDCRLGKKPFVGFLWQKCPVCNGRKEINSVEDYPFYGTIPCPVCKGHGILNQFGNPPQE